jgi:hypothetical protein
MVDEKKEGPAAGEEESSGFKVTDKRKFSDDGDRKKEAAAPEAAAPEAAAPEAAAPKEEPVDDQDDPTIDPSMMEVNFSNFVLSLGTSAVLHFGEFPDPVSGKQEQNLPMAKHTIDILNMLRDKTSGNLEAEEEKLLSDLLYQLRMKYVSLT